MTGSATAAWWSSPLGGSRLLARAGADRLHLLNASAAALWDRYRPADATPADHLAEWLTATHGVPAGEARAQVAGLLAAWRAAGLLDPAPATPAATPWVIPPPPPRPLARAERAVELAGLVMGLALDAADLGPRLWPACAVRNAATAATACA